MPALLRFGDHVAERLRIERHDHDHVDAARDQVLDLRDLPRFARIGRLHRHLRAELRRGGDEVVAVARPALDAQIVDTEADLGLILAGVSERRRPSTGWRASLRTRANSIPYGALLISCLTPFYGWLPARSQYAREMDRRRNLPVRRESVFAVVGIKSWGSCDSVERVLHARAAIAKLTASRDVFCSAGRRSTSRYRSPG